MWLKRSYKGYSKGLSTIIATLLIVILVFVAVGILWVVVKNVLQSGAEQVSLGKFTLDLKVEKVQAVGNNLSVTIKRNVGSGEFVGLVFIVDDAQNSETFTENGSMNELEKRTFNLTLVNINPNRITKIKVAPIFTLSSGKQVTGDIKDIYEVPPGGLVSTEATGCNNNGIIDAGEVCDGTNLTTTLCSSVISGSTGTLKCKSDCTYNTSTCSIASCGDGIVQTTNGEECDNGTLNAMTCTASYGNSCTYCETNSCQIKTIIGPYCGDNLINGNEVCDGTNISSSNTCSSVLGTNYTGTLSCTSSCTLNTALCTLISSGGSNGSSNISGLTYPSTPTTLIHMETCSSGDKVIIQADGSKKIHLTSKMDAGVAMYRLYPNTVADRIFDTSGAYVQTAVTEASIRNLNLPLTRIYHLAYEPWGINSTIDKLAIFADKEGISQENIVLELERSDYSYTNNKTFLTAQQWADAVRYSMSKGYKFRIWEVSNEPQYTWGTGLEWASNYSNHVIAVYDAIKAVQPNAIVGAQVNRLSSWSTQLLSGAKGHYDFIAGHFYAFASNTSKFEDEVLIENYRTINNVVKIGTQIRTYNPSNPNIYQMDTEWRLYYGGGAFEAQNGNIWATVHAAVRLIYYMRDGYMHGANYWVMNGGFPDAVVPTGYDWSSQNTSLQGRLLEGGYSLNYWLFYYMIHNTGEIVLDSSATTGPCYTGTVKRNVDDGSALPETFTGPQVPVMVTMSSDSKNMYITMANGNWSSSHPFEIDISNYNFNTMSGISIVGDGRLDGDWFCSTLSTCTNNLQLFSNANKNIITGVIPAHSVAFVTLQ